LGATKRVGAMKTNRMAPLGRAKGEKEDQGEKSGKKLFGVKEKPT